LHFFLLGTNFKQIQEGGKARNWKANIYTLARLEEASGASQSLQRRFKDGSFSVILPKALARFNWISNNQGALCLAKGQWVGVVAEVPNTSYVIGLVASSSSRDFVEFRGARIRARLGYFPRDVIVYRYPITLDYSPRTFNLKMSFTYWPFNAHGVFLGGSGAQLHQYWL
jgi:hypothetical protein